MSLASPSQGQPPGVDTPGRPSLSLPLWPLLFLTLLWLPSPAPQLPPAENISLCTWSPTDPGPQLTFYLLLARMDGCQQDV